MHAGRAQRLHGEKIAEQRAVGDIDRNQAGSRHRRGGRIGSAPAPAASPGLRPSDMACPAISAISAASRNPMLRPCAPIGGTTWADSPTSAMRWLANCRGLLDRQRKHVATGFDLDAAENGMRLLFRGLRQFVVTERHQPFGFLRSCETHTTLLRLPGRGTNTHGPCGVWNSVEMLVVRPRMGDVEGQRRLMQVAAADLDPGSRRGTAIAARPRRSPAARTSCCPGRYGW